GATWPDGSARASGHAGWRVRHDRDRCLATPADRGQTVPATREAPMRVIDVQVHAYERNHPGRPWVGVLHGPQSANGEEMTSAMDAVGVDAAIIVSTFNLYRYDPSYALSVYAAYPDR